VGGALLSPRASRACLRVLGWVWGLGFGFRVWGLGFRAEGWGFGVKALGFEVSELGFGVSGLRV